MPHFDVFGVDHSPWVQAVLLGLHDKGVPHTLATAPPLSVFRKSGTMMPAASIDEGPWFLESADILVRAGFERISPDDLRAIYAAWRGVLHRPDQAVRFWRRFSLCRDTSPSSLRRLRNHFLRSFSTLYFYLLIRFAVLTRAQPDPEDFAVQFLAWERQFHMSVGPFLGGDAPDMRDLMLFGVVQCHCSIMVPPVAALRDDPRLPLTRSWIGRMQQRFADYPHLYSGVYFAPHAPAPDAAPGLERAAFWLGSTAMLAVFPITIPLIVFFIVRARRKAQAS